MITGNPETGAVSQLARHRTFVISASIPGREDTSQVRLSHDVVKVHATFDDPDLVSHAGLVPVMALAQRAGLGDLVAGHVRIGRACGVNAQVKVPGIVAGMIGGADCIDDLDVLWHGAMRELFGGIRAVRRPGRAARRACGRGSRGLATGAACLTNNAIVDEQIASR